VDTAPRAGASVTGPGVFSPTLGAHPELNRILAKSLEKLAVLEGLTVLEVAARCIITSSTPTFPAFSREVVAAYARLEAELTRGVTLNVMA
jgi:hypothetical protein